MRCMGEKKAARPWRAVLLWTVKQWPSCVRPQQTSKPYRCRSHDCQASFQKPFKGEGKSSCSRGEAACFFSALSSPLSSLFLCGLLFFHNNLFRLALQSLTCPHRAHTYVIGYTWQLAPGYHGNRRPCQLWSTYSIMKHLCSVKSVMLWTSLPSLIKQIAFDQHGISLGKKSESVHYLLLGRLWLVLSKCNQYQFIVDFSPH